MSELNDTFIEYVGRYLRHELSQQDRLQFELLMSKNDGLRQEFESQKAMFSLIELETLTQIKEIAKNEIVKRKKSRNLKKSLSVAGILTVMLGTAYIFVTTEKQVDTQPQIVTTENVSSKKTLIVNTDSKTKQKESNYKRHEEVVATSVAKKPENNLTEIKKDSKLDSQPVFIQEDSTEDLVLEASPILENQNEIEAVVEENMTQSIVSKEEVLDPCDTITFPEIDIIHPSVINEDGQISFSTIENFEFIVSSDDEPINDFSQLSSGSYSVVSEHLNGCSKKYDPVLLVRKPCARENSFIFESAFQDELLLPVIEELNSNITIFSKRKTVLLRTTVSDESNFIWDRTLGDGNVAGTGTYIVVIETDNNKPCKYSVVVTE